MTDVGAMASPGEAGGRGFSKSDLVQAVFKLISASIGDAAVELLPRRQHKHYLHPWHRRFVQNAIAVLLAFGFCTIANTQSSYANSPIPFQLPQNGKPSCVAIELKSSGSIFGMGVDPSFADEFPGPGTGHRFLEELQIQLDEVLRSIPELVAENDKCLIERKLSDINYLVVQYIVDIDLSGTFMTDSESQKFKWIGYRVDYSILNCSKTCATLWAVPTILVRHDKGADAQTNIESNKKIARSLAGNARGILQFIHSQSNKGEPK